jgi:hypothetical protein
MRMHDSFYNLQFLIVIQSLPLIDLALSLLDEVSEITLRKTT